MGATLFIPTKAFSVQVLCDSSGNKMVVPTTVHRCLDTSSGLYISYEVYGAWTLYSPTGSVIETYGATTIQNPNDDLCGLPDTPTAVGYATDGSGNYVSVTDYYHWNYIYDPNGNIIDGFVACPS